MDNLTHSLVGAALGRAGLYRRTRFAAGALIIGANLPDIDVIGFLFGRNLDFRRGITHGPLAMLVLPALLTVALVLYAKWRPPKKGSSVPPLVPAQLLLLSYIGVLTHPFMDWLNSYGIRLLYPFSDRWFYGDGIFIVDPWIWLMLGVGVWMSRKRWQRWATGGNAVGVDGAAGDAARNIARPARYALGATALYIGLMLAGSAYVRHSVLKAELAAGHEVEAVMAAPVPINPVMRSVVVQHNGSYTAGRENLVTDRRIAVEQIIPANTENAAVVRAVSDGAFAAFLYWSRFPVFQVHENGDSVQVTVGDVRFAPIGGFSDSFRESVTIGR